MRGVTTRRELLWTSAAFAGLGLAGADNSGVGAQGNTVLKVSSFPGVTNFPIFAAEHTGLFAKYGLTIDLVYTPNSCVQRDGLAKGEYQIIQTAADNCVAMVELDRADAMIVAGGDNGFYHIIAFSPRSIGCPTCAEKRSLWMRQIPHSRCFCTQLSGTAA